MKDFKVFTEHAELAAEWNRTLDEMREKAGKKKAPGKKDSGKEAKRSDLPITKNVALNPDSAGLRLKLRNPREGEGDEATLMSVNPPNVTVSDPDGDEVEMNATSLMTNFKVD